jgi:hypothetical protein
MVERIDIQEQAQAPGSRTSGQCLGGILVEELNLGQRIQLPCLTFSG